MAAYCDLNVLPGKDTSICYLTSQMAIKLGYQIVAINHHAGELRGKKGKGPAMEVKLPSELLLEERRIAQLNKSTGRSFRQLSRFTAVINDPGQTHKLQTAEIKAYDLLAVEPTSEKTFHLACTSLEVDIISLDFTQKLPFRIRRPSVGVAIERGIHFEILYSPAIIDSTSRKNIIANSLALMTICKGKGIDLRGPYDVTNLGLLFGLTHTQARDAISKNCRAVIFHAESRKAEKSTISVIKASTLSLKNKESPDEDEPVSKKRKT